MGRNQWKAARRYARTFHGQAGRDALRKLEREHSSITGLFRAMHARELAEAGQWRARGHKDLARERLGWARRTRLRDIPDAIACEARA